MQNGYNKSVVVLCLVLASHAKNLAKSKSDYISGDDCNPTPNGDGIHYIIGYGSLIKTSSKQLTYNNTGVNIPVEIRGYQRQWNLKGVSIGLDATYLGIVADKDSIFNGVIFELPRSEHVASLKSYDEREHFYCRKQVHTKDIKLLVPGNDTISSKDAYYWIYVNKGTHIGEASVNNPIVQSYVDIFISGCIEIEEKYNLKYFARECVKTTHGWNTLHWVNDRIYPRRPFVYVPKAREIDETLHDVIPLEFKNIRFDNFNLI